MADTEKHQGWTNFVTWCVNMSISNTQNTHRAAQEQAEYETLKAPTCPQVAAGTWTPEEAVRFNLAAWLDRWTHALVSRPLSEAAGSGFAELLRVDLLQRALLEVNWDEIAAAYLEGIEAPT